MHHARVSLWVLAVALCAAGSARGDDLVPIAPCAVLGAGAGEPLVAAAARTFAILAGRCPVSSAATAVSVEVRTLALSAPAHLIAAAASGRPDDDTVFEASPELPGRTTVRVPLGPGLAGRLALSMSVAGAAGEARVAADVVGYYEASATFSGTTGFIRTRPTCAPPGYTPDALNYLQGPEPLALPNGDVTLLVGAGRCCNGTHWEGLFSLTYPAAGRAATPRFRGLWASNDFNRKRSRKEAEVGFPSALYYGGKWRIALTTTFLPFHRPDRDRVGRIDLPDLDTRATPAQVTNQWVQPIDKKCRKIAGCPGDGSGIDPVLTLHPNGDLYLYHRDGNYAACPSGYVRHKVAPNLAPVSAVPPACVRFEGLTAAPFFISDMARTGDGTMSLLVEKLEGPGYIAEWSSEGDPAEIGLLWRPTGRVWPAPSHPKGAPWSYYVRDAAFLKDESRTIVEPEVVVAQISDGTSYSQIVDVQLGRWYLYYWADDGAELPPTFGGPANGCALQGAQESTTCSDVHGWAWDPMFPNSPVSVDVFVDGVYAATVAADQYRADLENGGRGDGRHGFAWTIPDALRNGRKHRVAVRYAGYAEALSGKPKPITCH